MTDTDWTHVLLVRHGEVAAEHQDTFYGSAEVALSEDGEIGSPLLAAKIVEKYDQPDAVWSSPLSRTLALAEPLAAIAGLEVEIEPGLLELDRGSWTHLSHTQLEEQSPGAIAAYLEDPETGNAPGGETESAFSKRVYEAFDRAVATNPGELIVIVAHGHVIRVLMMRAKGWDVATSFKHFVPYHSIVEMRAQPGGPSEVIAAPEGSQPRALRFTQR
ncbi:MAG: histidine phosphatase family protein [Planctomycetota bacterium]|jgi:broad specificity phosphatase PhoE|nr:histidine phosphatase family protein [Planctomycetota bacterium]